MIVLIPAYRPGANLPDIVSAILGRRPDLEVLLVDDGSGPESAPVFAAAVAQGAHLLTHPRNLGKGAALRTGTAHVRTRYPGRGLVCADADGQHSIDDIIAVADETERTGTMVLGVRAFDHDVPLRSKVGNTITAKLFRLVTGRALNDTQTGLRGYPAPLLGWLLTVPGDRYEYELSVLLRASRERIEWRTVPIETIYQHGNESSHFRPIADSVRIYLPLLAFGASSLTAFGIDTVALLVLNAATGSLGLSVVGARLLSATANFLINRKVVFSNGQATPLRRAVTRYLALALVLVASSYLLLLGLASVGVPLLVAKVGSEIALFILSYLVQHRLVFNGRSVTTLSPTSQETPSRAPVA